MVTKASDEAVFPPGEMARLSAMRALAAVLWTFIK
jgi:hypothetical protein